MMQPYQHCNHRCSHQTPKIQHPRAYSFLCRKAVLPVLEKNKILVMLQTRELSEDSYPHARRVSATPMIFLLRIASYRISLARILSWSGGAQHVVRDISSKTIQVLTLLVGNIGYLNVLKTIRRVRNTARRVDVSKTNCVKVGVGCWIVTLVHWYRSRFRPAIKLDKHEIIIKSILVICWMRKNRFDSNCLGGLVVV